MNEKQWKDWAEDLALARYAVIAPLVTRTLSKSEYRDEFQKAVSAIHQFPDGERVVSRRTLSRWCDWYRNGHQHKSGDRDSEPGIDALRPTRRQDHHQVRVLEPGVIEQAVRLRAEEPSRSTTTLVELIKSTAKDLGQEPPKIEPATLAYHLRSRGATRRDFKHKGRAYPRYEHPYRNSCWQGDWSTGIQVQDPLKPKTTRLCHLHAFIDDWSRFIPHAEFYFRQNLPCLEDCFRKAVLNGGIPHRTYWDNGAVYQARQIRLLAARMGIRVIFATPYAPEGKGKVERFFRTVKDRFYPEAKRAGLTTLAELNEFFWAWLDKSYHDKEHGSLEGKTPRDRWDAGSSEIRMPAPASLVDLFLWEETRKVNKSGCIKLGGNLYPAGEHLVGQEVVVRFDPFEMDKVRLNTMSGVFLETVSPQTLTSRTYRKALPRRIEHPSPLESSTAYRKQLSKELREEVADTMSKVRSGLDGGCLTTAEFGSLFSEMIGERELTKAESRRLTDFFKRNAPLETEMVRAALTKAVDEKGCSLHIRFYLDKIQEQRFATPSTTTIHPGRQTRG